MIILIMVLGFVSLLLQIIFSFNLKGWKNYLLYQVTSEDQLRRKYFLLVNIRVHEKDAEVCASILRKYQRTTYWDIIQVLNLTTWFESINTVRQLDHQKIYLINTDRKLKAVVMPEQEQYITYSSLVSEVVMGENTPVSTCLLKWIKLLEASIYLV